MDRSDIVRRFIDDVNSREWDAAFQHFTDDCLVHAPGAGFHGAGRDEVKQGWSAIVEQADARYTLAGDPIHHKTLTVAFFDGEFATGGQRPSLPGVLVARFEGDRVSEAWGLRG